MKLWLMEGDGVGVGDYQSFMAQLCATQIRDWLSAGQQGEALLLQGKKPVRSKHRILQCWCAAATKRH